MAKHFFFFFPHLVRSLLRFFVVWTSAENELPVRNRFRNFNPLHPSRSFTLARSNTRSLCCKLPVELFKCEIVSPLILLHLARVRLWKIITFCISIALVIDCWPLFGPKLSETKEKLKLKKKKKKQLSLKKQFNLTLIEMQNNSRHLSFFESWN